MWKKGEKKRFSMIARLKSTNKALRGVLIFLRTGHNTWLAIFLSIVILYLGFLLKISHVEFVLLFIAIALVFIAEAFNTAIEIDIDLTSPEYHPYAKDTKDVSAGAVLIAVLFSVIIGIIIFLPKILILIINS